MIHLLSILAQIDYSSRLKGLQNAIRHEGNDPPQTGAIIGFLATIVALLITLLIVYRLQRRRSLSPLARRPYRLFTHVLRQLGLPLPDRLLFSFAAKRCNLRQPTLVLFSPELLNAHLGRWANTRRLRPVRHYVRRRVDALAASAFDSGAAQQVSLGGPPGR